MPTTVTMQFLHIEVQRCATIISTLRVAWSQVYVGLLRQSKDMPQRLVGDAELSGTIIQIGIWWQPVADGPRVD